jgi:hypothetical protein
VKATCRDSAQGEGLGPRQVHRLSRWDRGYKAESRKFRGAPGVGVGGGHTVEKRTRQLKAANRHKSGFLAKMVLEWVNPPGNSRERAPNQSQPGPKRRARKLCGVAPVSWRVHCFRADTCRWAASATPTTTPCVRASSPRSSVSSWIVNGSARSSTPGWRSLSFPPQP